MDAESKQFWGNEQIGEIYENKKFSDCIVMVENNGKTRTFAAHKMILAMRSVVFESNLYPSDVETDQPVCSVSLTSCCHEAFEAVLKYCYTGCLQISTMEHALQLLKVTTKLAMPVAMAKSAAFIINDLSAENTAITFDFYTRAQLAYNDCKLFAAIVSKFENETEAALNDPSWEDIDLASMLKLLSFDCLNIASELDLLKAVHRWALKACLREKLPPTAENLRKMCPGAIEKVRFLTLTPLQFAQGVAKSPILTKDEAFALGVNIADPFRVGEVQPVPPGFSTSLIPRRSLTQSDIPEPLREKVNAGIIYSLFRAVGNPGPYLVEPQTPCLVDFRVDVNIALSGIALATKLPQSKTSQYLERVKLAFLKKTSVDSLNFEEVLSLNYSSVVSPGQYVFVNLPNPIYVKKNLPLRIVVEMVEPGLYPATCVMPYCPVVQLMDNAKATFTFTMRSWTLVRALFFNA